jgi:hypothetical protein
MDTLINFVAQYDTNIMLGFTSLALLALLALSISNLNKERSKRRELEHELSLVKTQFTFAKEDAACHSANLTVTINGIFSELPPSQKVSLRFVERMLRNQYGYTALTPDGVRDRVRYALACDEETDNLPANDFSDDLTDNETQKEHA